MISSTTTQIQDLSNHSCGVEEIPTSYVVCEGDRTCLPEWQAAMLANAEKQGVHVDTYRINASHSPFLSQPEKLAEVIRQATGEEI